MGGASTGGGGGRPGLSPTLRGEADTTFRLAPKGSPAFCVYYPLGPFFRPPRATPCNSGLAFSDDRAVEQPLVGPVEIHTGPRASVAEMEPPRSEVFAKTSKERGHRDLHLLFLD